jgi:hypothetical protein
MQDEVDYSLGIHTHYRAIVRITEKMKQIKSILETLDQPISDSAYTFDVYAIQLKNASNGTEWYNFLEFDLNDSVNVDF